MQPNAPYPQNTPGQAPPSNDYAFITNPGTPSYKKPLPGSGSPITRALIVLGGLLVLIIIFIALKGVLSSGSSGPLYIGVAQDQQAMIHITDNASMEPSLSGPNKNFAITADLSLISDQSKTVSYIQASGIKLDGKNINLKVSLPLDTQLTNAAAASNYNAVFDQIMQTKLNNYDQALQQAFDKTPGPKGRALLKSENSNVQLLLKQLAAAVAAGSGQ